MSASKVAREGRLLPGGVPRWVRVYDDAEWSPAVFIVVFTGKVSHEGDEGSRSARFYPYIMLGEEPTTEPQACENKGQPIDTTREYRNGWFWPPAIGRKHYNLGKRIAFTDLPAACQKIALETYRELWGI